RRRTRARRCRRHRGLRHRPCGRRCSRGARRAWRGHVRYDYRSRQDSIRSTRGRGARSPLARRKATRMNPLDDTTVDPFEIARQAAEQLAEKTGVERHDIALTLGSGWAKAADLIGETTATIPATEIVGFS